MSAQVEGLGQPTSKTIRGLIHSVRLFTRDMPELNILVKGEASSDRMIVWAALDFLSDFNGSPPLTGYSIEDLVALNQQYFIVRGTVISLLQSQMILSARNDLPFSDGGLSIRIHDKAPVIQSMLQLFQAKYEQDKSRLKVALNINGILDDGGGGLHSDYSVLEGWYW